jgi:long-chain acyl-CoA synthetase
MSGEEGAGGDYLTELRRVAAVRPDVKAVIDESGSLTYGALVEAVDERAGCLADAGLQPGDRVALVAENSSSFLVSALAVWTAGGILVTVYPSSGLDDLRYALDNAEPVIVLVDDATADVVRKVAPDGLPVVTIDSPDFRPPTVRPGTMPNPAGLREPVFLICYSSGTTSRPKAIMLSQTALYNGARTYADVWHLSAADRTLVALPMAWLYGLDSTSMATLLVGGTVISCRRARPDVLVDAIETERVTILPGVTTIFTKLVDFLERSPQHHDLSSLRLAISGGEPRNERAFARFAKLAGSPVHDTFCASECFPLITYDPVANPEPVLGSAGRLVPRSELKILDPEGSPVPIGEAGEAFSRGPGLMLGYWRDDGATRTALTSDGWYRTKDLVRMDVDGWVYVVGRLSDMIIRGGSNVSPAEVERGLREHADLGDACVVGLPDPVYGQAVAAAVVLRHGWSFDAGDVQRQLAEHLAMYKVPTRWMVLERLPHNVTTGKLDRRAVAAAFAEEGETTS